MSSIALFYCNFVLEEELKKQLAATTGYTLVCDVDLLEDVAHRSGMDLKKLQRAAFGTKSVFNQFTLEKERAQAWLKTAVAGAMLKDGIILCGLSALLVPPAVTHVLRVAVFDEKRNRIQRALEEGMTEKGAEKLLKKCDDEALDFSMRIHGKPFIDTSLYDISIPAGELTAREMALLILEHYHRPGILPSDASLQAARDFRIAADAELALVLKGYAPTVLCEGGHVTLKVHKSSFNFTRLAETMRGIISSVEGVEGIEVLASGDSAVSIISDQQFVLPPKVLLVDDERDFVQTLSERLVTRQYGSYPVFDGEQALECLETETPDVMVLDLKMPGVQGLEVLEKTKKAKPEIEIIVLTGHGSEEDRATCLKMGAFAYLQKPVDIKELTEVIDRAYKKVADEKLKSIEGAA